MTTTKIVRSVGFFAVCFLSLAAHAASSWHPVGGNLMTRWAKDVDPVQPWPEYPRPQMVRPHWQNLNGLWGYTITDKDAAVPSRDTGQILVPYPIESALSGVKQPLLPNQNLWYHRTFKRPPLAGGERLLLHFGAVDFETTAFVNGREVGRHAGGYQSFTFDITEASHSGSNNLRVKVWDPTDQGSKNPRGKQVLKPEGIVYTATSGIWQTVWLETVPAQSIDSLVLTPDVDHGALKILVRSNATQGYRVEASSGNAKIAGATNEVLTLEVPNPRLWSPSDPHLYDLDVRLLRNGRVVDKVRSYFGLRKIEIQKDAKGKQRIYLNGRYTYNLGVLDQGFWPDGLHSAPADAALEWDVATIKSMGFNTIRKHIKIEPARWYYYCDTLGIMVWQDMVPPGGNWADPEPTLEAKTQFEAEVRENLAQLHNYPSITTWVLFNEGWGDYDQDRLTQWLKDLDPSRLVNGHTGSVTLDKGSLASTDGTSGAATDMIDIHAYPGPAMLRRGNMNKAQVLGEYGGISVQVKDHMWAKPNWSYEESAPENLLARYKALVDSTVQLEADGLTASIYTQPFDVEIEQNGLVTYDREVIKIPVDEMRRINSALIH
jgi:beta-galactosidase/beta-glucuronidase